MFAVCAVCAGVWRVRTLAVPDPSASLCTYAPMHPISTAILTRALNF